MLKTAIDFGPAETVTLVPNSGIQFLDLAFHEDALTGLARAVTHVGDLGDPTALTIYPTHRVRDGEDDDADELLVYRPKGEDRPREADEDETYAIKSQAAVARFDRLWLPFPIFRRAGRAFDEGPTTWARAMVLKLDAPDDRGRTHRVVLAFDTLLAPRLPGQPYTTPEAPSDATDKVSFGFSADPDANVPFCSLPWVAAWLREQYARGLTREKGRPVTPEAFANPGEHWAAYMALIDAISACCVVPNIEIVDMFSDIARETPPVDVNLVLDIGNSRMCGVLVENGRSDTLADLSDLARLELRDLTSVAQAYSEPFESRVEFATSDFGPIAHAAQSQRTAREAFFWPSPVRVGPEAAQLAARTDGTEGASGLSSPKRYLWDTEARALPWINNAANVAPGGERQEIRGPIVSRLTESGELVSKSKKGALPGLLRRYSRSALYTLMLAELLIHAIVQVNSVAARRNRRDAAIPRRLSQIILTLPTATPLAEQKLIRKRASEAVELVWQTMGFDAEDADGTPVQPRPGVRLDWDEASCTHLVYLFNELQDKFNGSPRDFISMIAQPPRNAAGSESLTVASIDIGGGTTDLMILSHDVQEGTNTVLMPRQLFREGFRLAGDDVLKEVIEHHLLPQVEAWLGRAGADDVRRALVRVFGGNREDLGQRERTMRAQLVSRLFAPAAVGLMRRYDGSEPAGDGPPALRELVPDGAVLPQPALAWFAEAARLPEGVDLLDAEVAVDAEAIDRLVDGLAGPMIRDLCDLVRAHDCDILLVSGRPSNYPAFRRLIAASMPVPANRIVHMGDYRVGNWYPFRSAEARIRDPKTTAVVGAMLSHMCSNQAVGDLTLRPEGLKMRSTARFIGAMDGEGRIPEDRILLRDANLDAEGGVDEFKMEFESPCYIGFRQLPVPRWRGTPLYAVRLKNPERTLAKARLPLTVTFSRPDQVREGEEEQAIEDFRVGDVEDATGEPFRGAIECRLQTMVVERQSEAGYWLDTGVLQLPEDA